MGFNAETEGRVARVEISVYDAMLAEILGEHIAEKCKVRNRYHAEKKHKAENWEQEKLARKDRHYDHLERDSRRKYGHGKTCYWASNAERKICHAEIVARKDYDAEIRQHEDAIAEYDDYCLMEEQHEERLEYLRSLTGNVEFWEIMIDEISREKIYEENRIREMRNIANTIMEGECY